MLKLYSGRNYSSISSEIDEVGGEIKIENHSLLHKQRYFVMPFTIVIYIILQIIAGYDSKICNDHIEFPFWVWNINVFVVIWFFIDLVFTIFYMMKDKYDAERFAASAMNLTLVFIVLSSSVLTLLPRWGSICKDYFGVISPSAQWPEWITSVPLLFYMAVACSSSKSNLDNIDIIMIFCMVLTILFGFLLNLKFTFWLNVLCLMLSCTSVSVVVLLAIQAQRQLELQITSSKEKLNSLSKNTKNNAQLRLKTVKRKYDQLKIALKKKNLSLICLVGLPLFAIIYFLSLIKIIDEFVTFATFMVVGLLFKSIMGGLLMAGHISLYEDIHYEETVAFLEKEIHEQNSMLSFVENKFTKTRFEIKHVRNGNNCMFISYEHAY